MSYSYEEAKQLVYDQHLRKNKPDSDAVIFDDWTEQTSFGWCFYFNNSTYHRTRDQRDAWAGPGPILFNRETGELRVFGSGTDPLIHIEDYEYELEASKSNSEWVIELDSHDFKFTALCFRRLFELSGSDALALAKQWARYGFIGKKRNLEIMRLALTKQGLNARVVLLDKEQAKQNCVIWREGDSFHDGYIRTFLTLRPPEAFERNDLDGKEVYIEGVLTSVNSTLVVISPGNSERYISFAQAEMIKSIQELVTGFLKDLGEFDISFKGTLRKKDDVAKVCDIERFDLRHRDLGYGYSKRVSKLK